MSGPTSKNELDPQQIEAVLRFMQFVGDTLQKTMHNLEHFTHCSQEEMQVMYLLGKNNSMMVKEIASGMEGVSLSKLTRVLDSLESQGYVVRSLNREDRRSFRVSLTEKGHGIIGCLSQNMQQLCQNVLLALTPTERLILVELFSKVQAHWQMPPEVLSQQGN